MVYISYLINTVVCQARSAEMPRDTNRRISGGRLDGSRKDTVVENEDYITSGDRTKRKGSMAGSSQSQSASHMNMVDVTEVEEGTILDNFR